MPSSTPIIVVSQLTPKAGHFDEFLQLQLAQQQGLSGQVPGLQGTRLLKGGDGRSVILMSIFASAEDRQRFQETAAFTSHLARVRDLVEPPKVGEYETVFEYGTV
jgi:heme-degrading monooxygenase HmoA